MAKELAFPTTQAQMVEYQKKKKAGQYSFTGGKWYEAPITPTEDKGGTGFGWQTKNGVFGFYDAEGNLIRTPGDEQQTGVGVGADVGVGAGVGVGVGDTGVGVGEGVTPETDYQELILGKLTELTELQKGYTPYGELRTQYREDLGIPGKEEAVTGLTEQVLDVEGLLDKLEGDITERTTGGLVTGAQRRRQLATEQRPLREQLADLVRAETRAGAGLTGARSELAEMMGLEEARRAGEREEALGMLPFYKEALAKPEPPEEPGAPTMKSWGGRQYQWDPSTQDWIDVGASGVPDTGTKKAPTGVTGANYNTRLNQEITNLYAGRYGKEGSREHIISALQSEFPDIDVSADIYSRVPDGYEAQVKGEGVVKKYITSDYIKENLESRLNVKTVLKKAGYAKLGKWKSEEYEDLVKHLVQFAENWRKAGYNDNEIWEEILKKIEGWEK